MHYLPLQVRKELGPAKQKKAAVVLCKLQGMMEVELRELSAINAKRMFTEQAKLEATSSARQGLTETVGNASPVANVVNSPEPE